MIIDFIDNLGTVAFQTDGPAAFGQAGFLAEGSAAQFAQFLNGYNLNRQWSSWTHFINEWRLFSGYSVANPGTAPTAGPAFNGLVADLKNALNIDAGGGDFLPYHTELGALFEQRIETLSEGLMSKILNEFPFAGDGSAPTPALFYSYLQEALTVTAYVLNATSASSQIATYESLYSSLFSTGFQQRVAAFIEDKISGGTFFTPSIFYNEWAETIIAEYKAAQLEVFSPNEMERRQTSTIVFNLLLQMLTLLQQSIKYQAQTAVYIANWQLEYTNCMDGTPIYARTSTNYAGITLSAIPNLAKKALENDESLEAGDFYIWFKNYHDPQIAGDANDAYAGPRGAYINFTDDNWESITHHTANTSTGPIPYTYYEYSNGPEGNHGAAEMRYLNNSNRQYTGPSAYGGTLKGNDLVIRQRWQGDGKENIDRRSSRNSVLNQYIVDQRSKRDALGSQEILIQNTLQNTNSSMNQLSDLLTTILEQMNTMMQAISKK